MEEDRSERHPSLDDRYDPAVRHDAAWPSSAEAELRRIAEQLGHAAVRLEHVGSTAVPGLAAKPILDLQLSVLDVEFRHLAFRDFLRAHGDEAASYADLKRQVAARHPHDRLAYIEGKDDYVTALEQRAVAWARRTS